MTAESMVSRVMMLKRSREMLADPHTPAKIRAKAAVSAMQVESYMLAHMDDLLEARERLLDEETLESLQYAGYIDLLLASFEDAGYSASAALAKATRR